MMKSSRAETSEELNREESRGVLAKNALRLFHDEWRRQKSRTRTDVATRNRKAAGAIPITV